MEKIILVLYFKPFVQNENNNISLLISLRLGPSQNLYFNPHIATKIRVYEYTVQCTLTVYNVN